MKRSILPLLATCIVAFPPHASAGVASTHGNRSVVVTVGTESQVLSGIFTERLKPAVYERRVNAYGEVVDVASFIEMRTSYLTAESSERKAQYQLSVSRSEYYRTLKLFHSSKYVSLEKLQNAEAAYRSDVTDSEAARVRMSNVRSELIQNWGRVIAGWVTGNHETARALADGRLSLVLITITAHPMTWKAPRSAEVVDASGNRVACRLVSSSPRSNQAIQGLDYFYSVARSSSLPTGLRIVAKLPVGQAVPGVVVPSSAVVWWHGKAWAYVETGGGRFARRPVDTAEPSGRGWFVKGGIIPGDRIVTKGAQLLLSQEFKSQIQGDDD